MSDLKKIKLELIEHIIQCEDLTTLKAIDMLLKEEKEGSTQLVSDEPVTYHTKKRTEEKIPEEILHLLKLSMESGQVTLHESVREFIK
jgi:hypothetical protein